MRLSRCPRARTASCPGTSWCVAEALELLGVESLVRICLRSSAGAARGGASMRSAEPRGRRWAARRCAELEADGADVHRPPQVLDPPRAPSRVAGRGRPSARRRDRGPRRGGPRWPGSSSATGAVSRRPSGSRSPVEVAAAPVRVDEQRPDRLIPPPHGQRHGERQRRRGTEGPRVAQRRPRRRRCRCRPRRAGLTPPRRGGRALDRPHGAARAGRSCAAAWLAWAAACPLPACAAAVAVARLSAARPLLAGVAAWPLPACTAAPVAPNTFAIEERVPARVENRRLAAGSTARGARRDTRARLAELEDVARDILGRRIAPPGASPPVRAPLSSLPARARYRRGAWRCWRRGRRRRARAGRPRRGPGGRCR